MKLLRTSLLALAGMAAAVPAWADLTLYSGRGETLVAPIVAAFTAETGIRVNVRYAGTAELAILLQEEGARSPADLFWAQDVAALGAIKPLFAPLPDSITGKVSAKERDADGAWVGTSGRMRLMIYSPDRVPEAELPASITELADPKWKGRIALAPTNGSFIAHVAALRVALGDEATLEWLKAFKANEPVTGRNNTALHQLIADGEADLAVTNNYYLSRFLSRDADFPVRHALFAEGDLGNLMMVAGIGVLATSDQKEEAQAFVEFLLSGTAQQFFTGTVYEYPVTGEAIAPVAGLGVSYAEGRAAAPEFDLNLLTDLEGTLALLREAGLL